MVMRSGKRMVCLKMRRSDDEGTQYATYADTSNEWDIAPAIPGAAGGAAGGGLRPDSKGGVTVPNAAYSSFNSSSANDVMASFNCNDSSCSNMSRLNTGGNNMQNPYPQYKFGKGFGGQNNESLSIELGTDANVGNLETLWKDLSGRYPAILGGYEPFYSVDAPADGQGKELFHLRVGPIKNLESGDSICGDLGRGGVFCSVVRTQ